MSADSALPPLSVRYFVPERLSDVMVLVLVDWQMHVKGRFRSCRREEGKGSLRGNLCT